MKKKEQKTKKTNKLLKCFLYSKMLPHKMHIQNCLITFFSKYLHYLKILADNNYHLS